MSVIPLTAPLDRETLRSLKAGDRVTLSGVIYTARDAAHGRLCTALSNGDPLPVDLCNYTSEKMRCQCIIGGFL